MNVTIIPTDAVEQFWPLAAPLIEKALGHAEEYDLDSVETMLLCGREHLWLVTEGAAPVAAFTTAVMSYPRKKKLLMHLCGGSRAAEWVPEAARLVEMWAGSTGCSEMEIVGRDGWGPMVEKLGAKKASAIFVKEVPDGRRRNN